MASDLELREKLPCPDISVFVRITLYFILAHAIDLFCNFFQYLVTIFRKRIKIIQQVNDQKFRCDIFRERPFSKIESSVTQLKLSVALMILHSFLIVELRSANSKTIVSIGRSN